MKNSLKYIGILSLFILFSCNGDDEDPVSKQGAGAFPKFENAPESVLGVNSVSEVDYTNTILDSNNNISTMTVKMYADLSGSRTDTVTLETVTSFPHTFNYTADVLASALGVGVSDINFGDKFFFESEATRTDGIVYTSEPSSFDASTEVLTLGGNTDTGLQAAGWRDALSFDFTIGCPAFSIEDVVGTYNLTNTLAFAGFFGETTTTYEIISGPGENQVTLVGGAYPTVSTGNAILQIDTTTGAVSLGQAENAFDASKGAFDTDDWGSASGTVFPCVGNISIVLDFSTYAGNPTAMELVKQ